MRTERISFEVQKERVTPGKLNVRAKYECVVEIEEDFLFSPLSSL